MLRPLCTWLPIKGRQTLLTTIPKECTRRAAATHPFPVALTGDGREEPEEHSGVVPGRQEAEALLQKHQSHEQYNGPNGGLVDDGADEGDEAEP